MTTQAPQTPHAPTAGPHGQTANQIKIYGHSSLFYWWPVWMVGFILAILTYSNKTTMIVVPASTKVKSGQVTIETENKEKQEKNTEQLGDRSVLVPPKEFPLDSPHLRMTTHRSYGVLFVILLVLIIIITNVPMRGMMSVAVIMGVVMLALLFSLLGWWDKFFGAFALLDIRINMGGYLFIAIALLAVWLVAFFVFDRRIYIIVAPGQVTVCLAIGDAESSYDATGAVSHKVPSDLFRHWILGMGSGDLEIRTSGSNAQSFQLHNVLGISSKLKLIQDLLRARQERAG